MLYTTLHNRILRLVLAVLGELIAAAALNLFIVPLSLYTGGLLGFCQLVRTLLQDFLGVSFGAYDIAGVLYFLLNIPLLMIGYRNLGRGLAVRTIICTVSYYNDNPDAGAMYRKFGILALEMETAGLYWTAQRLGKRALSLLTISDHIFTGESLSAQERQDSFHEMMEIALETAWKSLEG